MRPFALLVLAVLATSAAGQVSQNVTKLAKLKKYDSYSDVWGYVAPDGREYALSCARKGLSIVDCTDPTQPVEVAFFPGPSCTWRDVKAWGQYVYEVSECFGGVNVYDMGDPDEPVFVGNFGNFGGTHNVAVDLDAGTLWACGTNQGTHVFDLSVDPIDPPLVAFYDDLSDGDSPGGGGGADHGNGAKYVHDLWVQDGMAHMAELNAGKYRILGVDSLPDMPTMGSKTTFGEFTHSISVNDENTVSAVCDEKNGKRVCTLYDISNPADISPLSFYTPDSKAIAHNPYIKGDVLHLAYYVEGYRALDISDPSNPEEIGYYDTYTGATVPDYLGAWGAFPYTESGFVYVNDISAGLFILKLNVVEPERDGSPALVDVWPRTVDSLTVPRRTMVLTGADFTGASSVEVGPVALGPGLFDVLDDQTITFPMPLVPQLGPVDVVVTNGQGRSSGFSIDVVAPDQPVLESNPPVLSVGQFSGHTVASANPGDLHYLLWSPSNLPTVVPGIVSLGIGDGQTSLAVLPPKVANAGGWSQRALIADASMAGMEIYWQAGIVDAAVSTPVPVTEVRTITVVP